VAGSAAARYSENVIRLSRGPFIPARRAAPKPRRRPAVPKRLAAKLILSLTALVVVVEGFFGLINIRAQERQILDNMVVGADQLSKSIAGATWQAMLADHRDTAYEVMQTIATKQGIERITIFNREGRVMFSTNPAAETLVDKTAETCFVCHARERPLVRVDVPSRSRTYWSADNRRKLAIVTPIYNEPSCAQAACHAHPADLRVLGVLDVALDLEPIDRALTGMKVRTLAVVAAEITLIAMFIVYFSRRFVTRPIRKLVEGTKAVSAMQLDSPIEIDSSEELSELARSFNTMRERLKEAVLELGQFTHGLESMVEQRTDQLKVAQQKLIQSDRLASLGQLSASVAHEINNPLAGVLNLSMLMQRILKDDGIPPGRVEEFRKHLSRVVGETARVGRIVSDLLAFSRRSKPQRGPADLEAIVRSTVALVTHKLELANVRVEMDLHKGLPLVHCDASQIQQVVMNLVLNGAESIPGGGTVRVTTRAAAAKDSVMLEVRDTGVGIPPENLSRVFEPFFTTKEEGKGVGLGLAVVYGIVHAHGGDIEVESRVGEGATFRVSLPVAPVEPASPAALVGAGGREPG
jgi:two-component system, NtrC family, sensor kinase